MKFQFQRQNVRCPVCNYIDFMRIFRTWQMEKLQISFPEDGKGPLEKHKQDRTLNQSRLLL